MDFVLFVSEFQMKFRALPTLALFVAASMLIGCVPPMQDHSRRGRGNAEFSAYSMKPREARRAAREAESRQQMCKRTIEVTPPGYCFDQAEVDGRKLACAGKFLAKKVCKSQLNGAAADLDETGAFVVRYASNAACGIAIARATGGDYTADDFAVDVVKQGISDVFGKTAGDMISYAQVMSCIGNVDTACATSRVESVPCDEVASD